MTMIVDRVLVLSDGHKCHLNLQPTSEDASRYEVWHKAGGGAKSPKLYVKKGLLQSRPHRDADVVLVEIGKDGQEKGVRPSQTRFVAEISSMDGATGTCASDDTTLVGYVGGEPIIMPKPDYTIGASTGQQKDPSLIRVSLKELPPNQSVEDTFRHTVSGGTNGKKRTLRKVQSLRDSEHTTTTASAKGTTSDISTRSNTDSELLGGPDLSPPYNIKGQRIFKKPNTSDIDLINLQLDSMARAVQPFSKAGVMGTYLTEKTTTDSSADDDELRMETVIRRNRQQQSNGRRKARKYSNQYGAIAESPVNASSPRMQNVSIQVMSGSDRSPHVPVPQRKDAAQQASMHSVDEETNCLGDEEEQAESTETTTNPAILEVRRFSSEPMISQSPKLTRLVNAKPFDSKNENTDQRNAATQI